MKINLFRFTFLYSILNVCIKFIFLFWIDVFVQNAVGFEAYGNYFALLNLTRMIGLLYDFGVDQYVTHKLAGGASDHRQLLRSALGAKLLMLLLFCTVYLGAGFSLFTGDIPWTLVGGVLILGTVVCFHSFTRSLLLGLLDIRSDIFMSVIDKGLIVLVFTSAAFLPQLRHSLFSNINTYVYLQVAALIAAVIYGTYKSYLVLHVKTHGKEDSGLASVIRGGLPFGLFILLQAILVRIDIYFFSSEGSLERGYYASYFRFFEISLFLPAVVSSLVLPTFSDQTKDRYRERRQLNKMLNLLVILGFIGFVLAIFHAPLIYNAFYKEPFRHALSLPLVVISLVAYAIALIVASYHRALGRHTIPNLLFVFAILAKLILIAIVRMGDFAEMDTESAWMINGLIYALLAIIIFATTPELSDRSNMIREVLSVLLLMLIITVIVFLVDQFVRNRALALFLQLVLPMGLLFFSGKFRVIYAPRQDS